LSICTADAGNVAQIDVAQIDNLRSQMTKKSQVSNLRYNKEMKNYG